MMWGMCKRLNGGDFMATIRVTCNLERTVATLNATTVDAILAWIKANIVDKLPADTSVQYTLELTP